MPRLSLQIGTSSTLLLILLSSCGGDDSKKCTFVEDLVACNLLSRDALKVCSADKEPSAKDRAVADCSRECSEKASCADFTTLMCSDEITLSPGSADPMAESSSLRTCWDECHAKFAPFTCDGNKKYAEFEKCDGFERCEDGADERNCPGFACKSGETVPSREKCDGSDDCEDASDELGCPTFACKSGEAVSATYKCDGSDDCEDASDELGCPTFRCADGTTIAAVDKCDGVEQCEDASDEVGCTNRFDVMCPNGPNGEPMSGGSIRFE